MNSSSFVIETEDFKGPLELLLSLIEKRKLLINDVSLADVTEDYLTRIQELQESNVGEISDFIVIAATLMLIKSKSLLPNLNLTYEEEARITDLEERLEEYKKLQHISVNIEELFCVEPLFARSGRREVITFSPSPDISMSNLEDALSDVVAHLPAEKKRPRVNVAPTISLKEVIESIRERAESAFSTTFNEMTAHTKKERAAVIVHFLALLELVKQGVLDAHQEEGSDILIESQALDTPRYT